MAGVDDFANVGRLETEQIRALKGTEEQLAKWDGFQKDYRALQDRLQTLPDKVSHEVMVPFGPMAFMPGQLRHTNEITVLLGDDWFVERSAKQACEIVDRRLKAVDQQMADLRSQQKLLLSRREFTTGLRDETQDYIEIKEEYDPEQERLWREHHKKNVREQKRRARQTEEVESSPVGGSTEQAAEQTDEELWRRLEELELQETRNRELERLPDTPEINLSTHLQKDTNIVSGRRDSTDSGKKVRWKDEESDASSDGSGYEEDSEDEEHSIGRPQTIQIHHTPLSDIAKDTSPIEDESTSDIKSPADIYKYFGAVSPKSILKDPSTFPIEIRDKRPPDVKEKVIVPGSSSAFSGTIVEKASTSTPGATESSKTAETAPPKRVSKFKAQRQQNQR